MHYLKHSTTVFAVVICIPSMLLLGCGKEQKVIYSAESMSFKRGWERETEMECRAIHQNIDTYLGQGWRVVASSPKEKVVATDKGKCIGTEYVIEK